MRQAGLALRLAAWAVWLSISCTAGAAATNQATAPSLHAAKDVALNTDAGSPFWKAATPFVVANDPFGKPVAGHRMEVRSRWSSKYLYFLFACPYEELYLKPHPTTTTETFQLWDWDVAEVFLANDAKHINLYKEFEVSPQGEWVDLDIDSQHMDADNQWKWNSGILVKSQIDRNGKIWYGAMKIPYAAVDGRPAAAGNRLRANFFRIQGPPPARKEMSWQPTHAANFHVPEAFGEMELVAK